MDDRIYAGIDVSARELVVVRQAPEGCSQRKFSNDEPGYQALLGFLSPNGPNLEARVCLEPTGVYSIGVALFLHQASGVELMVPNPRAVRSFANAWMSRGKTDPQDARVLLEFAQRMPFVPWTPPLGCWAELKELVRYDRSLRQELAAVRNRVHRTEVNPTSPPAVRASLDRRIESLKQEIAHIETEQRTLIASDPELKQAFDLLVSMPGLGPMTATHLLAEVLGLPKDMQAKQWVAMAGLDVRERASGTSVRGRPRLSKVGNRHIRQVLYLSAMAAVRGPNAFREFYQRLLQRGKKKRQGLVAVMRKMLHGIYGILRYREPFNPKKLFPAQNSA
jgi:transposase